MRVQPGSSETVAPKPLRKLALDRSGAEAADGDAKGGHFVAPWRLDEAQQQDIIQALEQQQIGDAEGRRLLVGAMEYQLSSYRALAAAEASATPAPASVDTQLLQDLAERARELANLLAEIPPEQEPELLRTLTEQDEMGRDYPPRYLDLLHTEANRLGQASVSLSAQLQTAAPAAAAPTGASPAMLGLLSALAQVFEECFEQPATAATDGPFAATLAVIALSLGVEIPTTQSVLSRALEAKQS